MELFTVGYQGIDMFMKPRSQIKGRKKSSRNMWI